MLRRALEQQQLYQEEEQNENSNLLPLQQHEESYGATSSAQNDDFGEGNAIYDDDEDEEEEEEEYDDEEEEDEYWQTERSITDGIRRNGFLIRVWNIIKGCFTVVVNVENVWDSPSSSQGREISRRNHAIILFWFFILAISYTAERTAFKLLLDAAGPFRLFSVEMVSLMHALLVGSGMLVSAISRKNLKMQPLGIPIVDVGLMALLDTLHMQLVFLTGYHVAPTLTVILVQFTLPLTAMISQFVHPDGYFKKCCGQPQQQSQSQTNDVHDNTGQPLPGFGGLSIEHISGSIIISLAVLLALCPSIYTLIDKDFFRYATINEIPLQTALNTILFVSSCIPAAASQLYKEHIFLQYKQPVQPDYLNFVLSIFQLIFASIMSPLVYTLLGFAAADDWPKLYPSSEFSKNFAEGFQCFVGILSTEREKDGYHDEASCSRTFPLLIMYCFSVISVGVAVDKIVNGGGELSVLYIWCTWM
jgi:hypothetical protein